MQVEGTVDKITKLTFVQIIKLLLALSILLNYTLIVHIDKLNTDFLTQEKKNNSNLQKVELEKNIFIKLTLDMQEKAIKDGYKRDKTIDSLIIINSYQKK